MNRRTLLAGSIASVAALFARKIPVPAYEKKVRELGGVNLFDAYLSDADLEALRQSRDPYIYAEGGTWHCFLQSGHFTSTDGVTFTRVA